MPDKKHQQRQAIESFINGMPSLPTTVAKVIEVCNKPLTSPNDLNRLISLDPVLTGKVLRLINSAFFSIREPVASVTRAIIMLGLNTVKNLAISTSIVGIFRTEIHQGCFSMDDFWIHSLATGVTARLLAAESGVPFDGREEYFVGGLLHDIGKIPMMHCYPELYRHILKEAEAGGQALYKEEKTAFGFDHCQIGRIISEKWHLARNLDGAISEHHQTESEQSVVAFATYISLANRLANSFAWGLAGDAHGHKFDISALKIIGLGKIDLRQFQESVAAELEKAKIFMDVSGE